MVSKFIKHILSLKMTSTEEIVRDYIATCMRKSGYHNVWDAHYPIAHPPPAIETMRLFGEQFERAYFSAFDNMIEDFDVTAPDAEENFSGVAVDLFNNDVNWGRIIGLLVFASQLSLKAIHPDIHRQDLVNQIVNWTCNILQSDAIGNWMANHNSWVSSLISLYESIIWIRSSGLFRTLYFCRPCVEVVIRCIFDIVYCVYA